MGSSKQSSSSTQRTQAYQPAQAGINSGIGGITNWMNDPGSREVYGGQRTVGPSDMTQQGMAAYGNTGNQQASIDHLRGVIGGQGHNPNMDALLESVRAQTMPGINAAFSASGMGGSSMHQGVLARELGRATAPHLFGAYENDQSRRMQAAGMLPGIDERMGQRQIEAGQIGEGYERERIGADRQQFDETQMAGLRPYATAMPMLAGVGQQFGTTTGNQTSKSNPSLGQQIAGGAMMAGSLFTGNPMGMMGGGGMIGGGGTHDANGYAMELPWRRARA